MRAMMMMVFTSVLAASMVVGAAEVAVFPVKGTNLEAGETEAIGKLFSRAYAECSGESVIGPGAVRQALDKHGTAEATAAVLGVDLFVRLDAMKLTQKISVEAIIFDSAGQELFRVKMSAIGLDDMEQVSERLARALFDRVDPNKTRTSHNVTNKEANAENRVFAEKINGIKVAVTWPFSTDGVETRPAISAQYDLRLEGKDFFLEFGVGLMFPAGTEPRAYSSGFLEIGGCHYLIDANISPYLGIGLIPRIMIGSDLEGSVNIAPYAQAGVMFMRESSSRIYVDLRVAHNLFPHYNRPEDVVDAEPKHDFRLTELAVAVGIGW